MNFLYIDPGTGSMLFSLAIGIATAAVFAIRALAVKLKFVFSGGRTDVNKDKISYVIFSDHKRYWNVFKPVCDEFERRKIPLVYYTQSEDDPALDTDYKFVKAEFIGEGNKGIMKMNMLNAGTVLSTTPGLDVLQWKRSRNVDRYVHIPHSCDIEGYRMFGLDFYDSVLCVGQHHVDFLEKIETMRPLAPKKEKIIAGATFFDFASERISLLEKHDVNSDNPTVLLAPSWGPSSLLNRFGESLISALVETGFRIIVRPHPQSFSAEKEMLESLMTKFSSVEWNRDNDNLAVLNRADMLITDFSAIMYDWAFLFDRPFMYAETNYDTSVYDSCWLEGKPWLISTSEKIGIKLNEGEFGDIRRIILDSLKNTELSEARRSLKNECWQNPGKAAEITVDYMTGKK